MCIVTFTLHCTENLKQIFPEMKLHGLVPNFCINLSESDLYIPTIGPPIWPYCVWGLIVGLYKSLTDTRIEKFGTRRRSFIYGNICFEFSVQCICSADCFVHRGSLLHFHTYTGTHQSQYPPQSQ